MFTIIGKGFGLYGYLPALIAATHTKVLLAEEYRRIIQRRADLSPFTPHVEWRSSLEHAISDATGIVIAVPPLEQQRLVLDNLPLHTNKHFLLEKPIAASPLAADVLISHLTRAGSTYRVGYIFLYTDWYHKLDTSLCFVRHLDIRWHFLAHHVRTRKSTWKRSHSVGGGPLRFYGIHLLAVLASFGYSRAQESAMLATNSDEPVAWWANFDQQGTLPSVNVDVRTDSPETLFRVDALTHSGKRISVYDADSPLPHVHSGMLDNRVPLLTQLLHSFERLQQGMFTDLYKKTNVLWRSVEDAHRQGDIG